MAGRNTDLIGAEIAAQAIAGFAADLAGAIAHASYSNHADCVYTKHALDRMAEIQKCLDLIKAALNVSHPVGVVG